MAGPLGEMFDHGCDAINTTLECVLCCAALNLGRSSGRPPRSSHARQLLPDNVEEFHTGTLFLSAFSGRSRGF